MAKYGLDVSLGGSIENTELTLWNRGKLGLIRYHQNTMTHDHLASVSVGKVQS